MRRKGCLITFEGPEGSGKSSLIRSAATYLRGAGFRVVILREPGSTRIGEKIRRVLLDPRNKAMNLSTEVFLYLAARAQLVRERIRPFLARGSVVICDRFHDSTVAYQGFGGGIALKVIRAMEGLALEGVRPKLTFLLDVDTRKGLSRSGRKDRIERRPVSFHQRVRRGFLSLARQEPGRIVVIRDQKTIAEKEKIVKRKLQELFQIKC